MAGFLQPDSGPRPLTGAGEVRSFGQRVGAGGGGVRSGRGRRLAFWIATATVALILAAAAGVGLWMESPSASAARAARPLEPPRAAMADSPRRLPAEEGSSGQVAPPGLGPFRRAWVAVPVAAVWNHPGTARAVDAPAVSSTADIARWTQAMSYQQKLALDDLLATQALLYQPLFVYGHDGVWVHVMVLGQTGSVYPWGIAGWIPGDQVSYTPPPAAETHMTVTVPILRVGGLALSYGTVIPVAAVTPTEVTVALPTGRYEVPTPDLSTGSLHGGGPAVVAQAERFLGLPYLWAGTSSFGYDCSGLTYSVYRMFGLTLARDAADQAGAGTPVAKADLRPGDLVFFAFDGRTVDHVGIYAGNGMMVDSPHTGGSIELVQIWSAGLSPYYAGARRYM